MAGCPSQRISCAGEYVSPPVAEAGKRHIIPGDPLAEYQKVRIIYQHIGQLINDEIVTIPSIKEIATH